MIHIFVEKSSQIGDKIIVARESTNYNHLANVLRVKKNENILCSIFPYQSSFDYLTHVSEISKDNIVLDIKEKRKSNELPIKINLYQGISKFDKLEFIIEKAVELGVHTITPFQSEYCVVKLTDEKIEKKMERFSKIALAAAEQSKRSRVPIVNKPVDFMYIVKNLDPKNTMIFYENTVGLEATRRYIREYKGEEINVIVGPEGGFSEKEIENAKSYGINAYSLGNRILRTETAALTALSILMYEMEP